MHKSEFAAQFLACLMMVSLFLCLGADSALAERASKFKPVIGINLDIDGEQPKQGSITSTYWEAVLNAGGVPLLIPPMPEASLDRALQAVDGVLMIGGADYPPDLYGQKPHATTEVMHADRSAFDMLLVKKVLADKKLPFLGICAGCQALNIGAGGTLIQDIPSARPSSKIKHASADGWKKGFNRHKVSFNEGSQLVKCYEMPVVNVPTSHHQCVDKVGNGLQVAAITEDSSIEAIQSLERPFLIGVQWHPERDFETNKGLFDAFMQHARASKHSQGK